VRVTVPGPIDVDYYVDARDEKRAMKEARRRSKAAKRPVRGVRIVTLLEVMLRG
jgi:hypothetical protein